MSLTVIICEDNDSLRRSIRTLLENQPGIEVLADLPNGEQAGEMAAAFKPEVFVMDIDMPVVNGVDAVAAVKEASPDTAIIMFTQFEDDEKLFNSLCAGANGYILKKSAPGKLVDAIQEVVNGGAPMSPSIAKRVLGKFHQQQKPFHLRFGLTEREQQVLNLLTRGYVIKQIAAHLDISYETARSHLKNIYKKLHVNCGKEAIARVLAEKIL